MPTRRARLIAAVAIAGLTLPGMVRAQSLVYIDQIRPGQQPSVPWRAPAEEMLLSRLSGRVPIASTVVIGPPPQGAVFVAGSPVSAPVGNVFPAPQPPTGPIVTVIGSAGPTGQPIFLFGTPVPGAAPLVAALRR